jgi:NAD(P)-dependent dehydrogenase (short-subunit alcohol dehydrogenase family)
MLLEKKNAIIYGAGGAIGGAMAHAFARSGARVFLTGRQLASVEPVAREIRALGGTAEVAQVDAFDEPSVEAHADAVVAQAGSIDLSINTFSIPQRGIQGIPLLELPPESFVQPVTTYARSHFLTARAAARRMVKQGSGVILMHTAMPGSAPTPLVGGMGLVWAGMEALTRNLSAELSAQGIRVLCLRTDGIPETATIEEVFGLHAEAIGQTREQFERLAASLNPQQRLPTLAEVANVATFLASDQASAMTGTVVSFSTSSIV